MVLSQYVNAVYAFELFQDGTEGLAYLLKDRVGDVDELRTAVATVARGGSVIDPAVVERLPARDGASPSDRIADLTDGELRLLLVRTCWTNKVPASCARSGSSAGSPRTKEKTAGLYSNAPSKVCGFCCSQGWVKLTMKGWSVRSPSIASCWRSASPGRTAAPPGFDRPGVGYGSG